jgi:hypothetical protein
MKDQQKTSKSQRKWRLVERLLLVLMVALSGAKPEASLYDGEPGHGRNQPL